MWLLRDPLRLTDYQLIVPSAVAQLLLLLDGTRDVEAIRAAFSELVGEAVDPVVVTDTLSQLDKACLLENGRAHAAKAKLLETYRAEPYRRPALAGVSYPEDPADLKTLFQAYGENGSSKVEPSWHGRAIVSPHIDYQRGGPVYAQVWQQAAPAIADVDLVLILGTDHNGGLGTITLTEQPYATPFGVLPADRDVVRHLAQTIGEDQAFALELNHREEHSVELSAVWLHYLYEQQGIEPAPMVPVLCGSFQHFVSNGHHPAADDTMNGFVSALREATAGRKVLTVASVDLAHVGPAFGDPFAIDRPRRQQLRHRDHSLIAAINAGDHRRFYREVAEIKDRNRICGFSSLYLMLRYLEDAQGTMVAYEQCPADQQDRSLVSICGLLLS
jgi:AmmeMemoRadiSam system protein B